MRKIFLAMLLLASINSYCQVNFSCVWRDYCKWNDYAKEFQDCEGYEDKSLFTMNKYETMFTHKTNDLESTYYVKSKEYNVEDDVYTYYVVSDVGNYYYYVFDPKNKQVRALRTQDGKTYMIIFYVKSIF